MKKNAFDKGYKIVWVGHCRAVLQRIPDLPIVEFYKAKYESAFDGSKKKYWNVRPLCMTDEKIDEALPENWQYKNMMGFKKFQDLEDWLAQI